VGARPFLQAWPRHHFVDGQPLLPRPQKGVFRSSAFQRSSNCAAMAIGDHFPDDPPQQSNLRDIAYSFTTSKNTRLTQSVTTSPITRAIRMPRLRTLRGRRHIRVDVVDKLYSELCETAGGRMRAGPSGRTFLPRAMRISSESLPAARLHSGRRLE